MKKGVDFSTPTDVRRLDFVNTSTEQLQSLQAAIRPLYAKSGDLFWDLQFFMDRLDTEIRRRTES